MSERTQSLSDTLIPDSHAQRNQEPSYGTSDSAVLLLLTCTTDHHSRRSASRSRHSLSTESCEEGRRHSGVQGYPTWQTWLAHRSGDEYFGSLQSTVLIRQWTVSRNFTACNGRLTRLTQLFAGPWKSLEAEACKRTLCWECSIV